MIDDDDVHNQGALAKLLRAQAPGVYREKIGSGATKRWQYGYRPLELYAARQARPDIASLVRELDVETCRPAAAHLNGQLVEWSNWAIDVLKQAGMPLSPPNVRYCVVKLLHRLKPDTREWEAAELLRKIENFNEIGAGFDGKARSFPVNRESITSTKFTVEDVCLAYGKIVLHVEKMGWRNYCDSTRIPGAKRATDVRLEKGDETRRAVCAAWNALLSRKPGLGQNGKVRNGKAMEAARFILADFGRGSRYAAASKQDKDLAELTDDYIARILRKM